MGNCQPFSLFNYFHHQIFLHHIFLSISKNVFFFPSCTVCSIVTQFSIFISTQQLWENTSMSNKFAEFFHLTVELLKHQQWWISVLNSLLLSFSLPWKHPYQKILFFMRKTWYGKLYKKIDTILTFTWKSRHWRMYPSKFRHVLVCSLSGNWISQFSLHIENGINFFFIK